MRSYLLGQLPEDEGEAVELRLLADAEFSEGLDVVVDELVDEYLDGKLTPDERGRAENYFFKAPQRREKLRFAAALKRYESGREFKRRRARSFTKFYLPLAASVLVAVGACALAWRALSRRPELDEGLVALRAAFRDRRPVEARISGFDYAPMRAQRGAQETADYLQRDRAAGLLQYAVTENPGAESFDALGEFYLASREFDKAVDQFGAALRLDPRDARAYNDLGAAQLEEGERDASGPEGGHAQEEFAKSLESLNKAVELDPTLPEALFNRALLYQNMGLYPQAESDWRAYLEKDPDSEWAGEARANLKRLEERRDKSVRDDARTLRDFYAAYESGDDARAWEAVRAGYTSAGSRVADALLDSYLELESKGDGEAAGERLRALAYAGRLAEERAGDAYLSDLARFYLQLSAARRGEVARARAEMKKGQELFAGTRVDEALAAYARAERGFDDAGDACESALAEYSAGHAYLFRPDLEKSEEIFARLMPACEARGYEWLYGQSLFREAGVKLERNEFSKSIEYANEALSLSERIGDSYGVLWTLVMLGDEYQSLGDERRALGYLRRALSLAGEGFAEPAQAWGIFTATAFNLNSLGHHAAALEYQKEALRLALSTGRPLLVSRSYDYLGQTYASLKRYDEALESISKAFDAGRGLSDEPGGREMLANSSLHAGDVYRQAGDQQRAVESYDRSIQIYGELGETYFAYPAHKGKLLSFMARGEDASTEEELGIVLGLFEQYRSKLTSGSQRNTFFDVEQSIYDLAVDFAQTRKADAQQAFEYSEASRARSLLDAVREGARVSERGGPPDLRFPSASRPLGLEDVRRRMPDGAQIVEYAALEDKLVVWVVTREGLSSEEVKIGSADLGEKVRAYLLAVKSSPADDGGEAARSARELYDLLVRPVEARLDKSKLLCVVPDKALNYLPFGALVSPATGKYLVQDFRVELSPSAGVFVDLSERAGRKASVAQERLLSVGDPSFDRAAFASLPALPSAGREAEEVAGLYKSPRLLLRDAARESSVKSEIARANVAHFAVHYVADPHSEMLSGLLLAAEAQTGTNGEDGDGVLRAHEIYRMTLPSTRLVVLSACRTGVEQEYRGEGAVGVARPFIAAGVPLVVASLWPVDSDATAALMVSFHRHRTRDRLPTAEALRRAQLELLADPRFSRPYYWAAFNTIGGYAEF